MPRSCFVRLRDDNRSPGATARAKDDLIKRQRVEKCASSGGLAVRYPAIRQTGVTEQSFVRVDVSEAFPFIVTKLMPYYER
jgi:hypothetical protein